MKLIRRVFVISATSYIALLALYLVLCTLVGDGVRWLSLVNSLALFSFLPLIVLLPLALLRTPRVIVGLGAIVAVCIVWYAPRLMPKVIAAPQGEILRIVTFNVWGRNPQLDDVETWLREIDADLVFMQEIPFSYGEEGVPTLLDIYPYQFNQTPEERRAGNVVLSRFPFVEAENVMFAGLGFDQRIVIEYNGQQIILYNVHFDMPHRETPHFTLPFESPYLNLALHYDDTARNAQIHGLISTIRNETGLTVVAGDFNMSDTAAIYNEVAAVMTDAYLTAGNGLGGSFPDAVGNPQLPDWLPPLVRIDYVWYRGGVRAVEAFVGPPLGSDHLPVVVTLELPAS